MDLVRYCRRIIKVCQMSKIIMGIMFDNTQKPKIVYKYYSWDQRFDSKRLNGYVYYSSPLNFNDKLDCNLPVANIPSNVDMTHLAKIVKESCSCEDEYVSFFNQVKTHDTINSVNCWSRNHIKSNQLC